MSVVESGYSCCPAVRIVGHHIGEDEGNGWESRRMSSSTEATVGVCSGGPLSPTNLNLSTGRVHEIDPLRDSRWESLIKRHPRSSVFHSTKWLKALQATYEYSPIVLTTCPPGCDLTNGLVLCQVRSWLTGRRLVSLPFSDHCEPLVENARELDELLLHTKQYIDIRKWKYIEIRPISGCPGDQTGFGESATYSFHSLDLRKSKQELFQAFHKDCIQRKVRRAEREKLQYEEGNSERLLQKFYDLLVLTRRRHCLPPQPLSWFRALLEAFGGDLKIRVASKDDLAIASILTLAHKKSLVYKYGCSDERFHKFGAMSFLFWNAIQEAKDLGCEEFDMGRSDSDNAGLIAFKGHWGAICVPLRYWTYPERPAGKSSSLKKTIVERTVSMAPEFALRAAGRLLYPHMA